MKDNFDPWDKERQMTKAEFDAMEDVLQERIKNTPVGEQGRFGRVVYRFNDLVIEVPDDCELTREDYEKKMNQLSNSPHKDVSNEKI